MDKQVRLRQVKRDEVSLTCTTLEQHGFKIFSIGTVDDAEAFFDQVKDAFPLDPAISGKVNWDAFADSLWGGLDACDESKIALVIGDATEFSETNDRGFNMAINCLADAASEVEAEKQSGGDENAEIVVVIGVASIS